MTMIPIPEHPDYYINRKGEVYSVRSDKVLKAGRGFVVLHGENIKVDLLVLSLFGKACPPGMKIIHLDGNFNNNALGNLTYDLPRCRRGHAFVEENVYYNPSRSDVKHCVTCRDDHYQDVQRVRRVEMRKAKKAPNA